MLFNGDSIQPSSGSQITIPTGYVIKGTDQASIYSPGSIIQVQSTTLTTTFSATPSVGSFTDITGLSVSITPKFTTSKILVTVVLTATSGNNTHTIVTRNTTPIGIATGSLGSRLAGSGGSYYNVTDTNQTRPSIIQHLDSPSSMSALTYQVRSNATGSIFYVNQSISDVDSNTTGRYTSSITVMEVAS